MVNNSEGIVGWDLESSLPSKYPNMEAMQAHIEACAEAGDPYNIWDQGEFHITCGATATNRLYTPKHWYSMSGPPDFEPQPIIHQDTALDLLGYLAGMVASGYKLVTWNGTAFDWRLLAQETGCPKLCARLALKSYDPMFQFLCMKGHPVGLQAASTAIGYDGKLMDGLDAIVEWPQQAAKVLDYVGQDAVLTVQVFEESVRAKGLAWLTKEHQEYNYWPWIYGPLTVQECLWLPQPDTSWMTHPIRREDQIGWIMEALNG